MYLARVWALSSVSLNATARQHHMVADVLAMHFAFTRHTGLSLQLPLRMQPDLVDKTPALARRLGGVALHLRWRRPVVGCINHIKYHKILPNPLKYIKIHENT